ncbi:Xaa-Pro aminopeptidase [Sphingomonas jejuensis]|uniref:Xaa-Pro aminopeptidase n=1 Tax=Sphingomonas jejuensis TaxID=904715 RepID=A0ABX0XLZ5_9SPHN|nr:aminopeptidase P family protein [Sphingomonas jejuensis]NJC34193.1 Xaa-Pro aminopeptidase [Sphingomonas jejuensis]
MSTHADRLRALRDQLSQQSLDGFVVPISDEHMSEYVGGYAQRLGWLTGFGGSAGTAVVLPAEAAIFTDGRYTLQVREQVSADHWSYQPVPEVSVAEWLSAHAPAGARIGYDPWLHTADWAKAAGDALAAKGATLVAVERNPIDAIWADQPGRSDARLSVQADEHAGVSSAAKRQDMADWLKTEGADAAVLSALDSVAWTFNVRGKDVDRTPVALSFALVRDDGTADLFVAPDKIGDDVRQHLGNGVRVHDIARFEAHLRGLAGRTVAVDPERSVAAIFSALEAAGATVLRRRDPSVLPRAIKNAAEQAGHRAAQARDGAAMARFLKWAAETLPGGGETELSAAARLEAFRAETGLLEDLSFDSISATGAHGASPHYRVTEESNARIEPGTLYLIDSGGQYRDGTTDITRTIAVGTPTAEMRDRFTRVLQGHIAIDRAVFPDGARGSQLDSFARAKLWEAGLDYGHGTGHGVGSFLGVHEGPQRIAASTYPGGGPAEPLRAGMILSNEPGYYKAGHWGIRIENLVLIEPREIDGAEGRFLGFETLTFAPIDRTLIDADALSGDERMWLDAYHAKVLQRIGPLVDADTRAWLTAQCAPISGDGAA